MSPDTTPLDAVAVGEKLRHLRKKHKKTLKDVATLAGCSESMLSKAERGHAMPSLDLLSRIAEIVGSSVAELFGRHPAKLRGLQRGRTRRAGTRSTRAAAARGWNG